MRTFILSIATIISSILSFAQSNGSNSDLRLVTEEIPDYPNNTTREFKFYVKNFENGIQAVFFDEKGYNESRWYVPNMVKNKFTGESAPYKIDASEVNKLSDLDDNCHIWCIKYLGTTDTITLVNNKVAGYSDDRGVLIAYNWHRMSENTLPDPSSENKTEEIKKEVAETYYYPSSDGTYFKLSNIVNFINYKGRELTCRDVWFRYDGNFASEKEVNQMLKSPDYNDSIDYFYLPPATDIRRMSPSENMNYELNKHKTRLSRQRVFFFDNTYIFVHDNQLGVSNFATVIPYNNTNKAIWPHLDYQEPLAYTNNGTTSEIRYKNGDYLKFSKMARYQAFDGVMHYKTGVLRVSNNGDKPIYEFDYTDGIKKGFTKRVTDPQLVIYDPQATGRLRIGSTMIDESNYDCFTTRAEEEFDRFNTGEFFVTSTKEPAEIIDGKLYSPSDAERILAQRKKEIEAQRKLEEQQQQQHDNAVKAKRKSIINRYYAKFGKTWVDKALNGQITTGMPWSMVSELFTCFVSSKYNNGYSTYIVILMPPEVDIEKDEIVPGNYFKNHRRIVISVSKGKVSSVHY